MRGTEDLLAEQKPRGTRRTQPYRRRRRRSNDVLGPSLSAMLKGRPTYLDNPMDLRRRLQKRGF